VAQGERVVGEWYWAGGSADAPRTTFSVTKSVSSTLVGLAQADGDLSLDDRAARYVPAWRGTPAAAVRVRDLLSNTSGRAWSTDSDYARLHEAPDRTAYAVGLAQQHGPGTVWAYNNAAIQTLDAVLAAATGTPTAEYARERLFGPLGMDHTALETRGGATSTYAWMTSTCRDLARFGLLFAQEGEWDGEQLLPRDFVRAAVGRPSQPMTSAYGLLWWLNRRGPVAEPLEPVGPGLPGAPRAARGQLVPGAGEDVFAALGLGGQVVLVDPRTDTVVVRLGDLQPDDLDAYTVRDAAALLPDGPT
jgi:CubicO group peptidase (beta-lactamase class C family)